MDWVQRVLNRYMNGRDSMSEDISIKQHFSLEGKRAIVIGAEFPAGAAIANAYAEAGANVALCAITADEAVMQIRRVKREIEAIGREAREYVMDVTLGRNVQVTMRQAVKELGGVDCVAITPDLFLAKPIGSITDTELARVMAVNFNAHFFAMRSAAAEFRKQGTPGRIVSVTSVLGERGLPHTSAYSAAHGAVHNLIRACSQEFGPDQIMVNGIALGYMDWMKDRIDPDDEEAQRALRFTIMRRAGRANEVAPLALYLSAESATRYITGQIFPVDGGLLQHL
mgnify:FL=1